MRNCVGVAAQTLSGGQLLSVNPSRVPLEYLEVSSTAVIEVKAQGVESQMPQDLVEVKQFWLVSSSLGKFQITWHIT
jgi:hypothetical protein